MSKITFIRGGCARSLEICGVRIVGRGSSDNIYSNVPYSAQTDFFLCALISSAVRVIAIVGIRYTGTAVWETARSSIEGSAPPFL